MSQAANDQVKEILWKLIEQHYNVNREEPQVLTAKTLVLGTNPIDKIGEDLTQIIEEMLKQTLDDYIESQTSSTPDNEFGFWFED